MPPSDVGTQLQELVSVGLKSVGCGIQPALDGNSLVVRNILVELGEEISCFRTENLEQPFATFPPESIDAAASTICAGILQGIATRAIEARFAELEQGHSGT